MWRWSGRAEESGGRGDGGGRRGRIGLALAAMVLLAATSGRAFVLRPPEGDFRGPRDPLRLELPRDIPRARLARLAVELDGIDITGMLRFEGGLLVFRPPTPLRPGRHRLRVVEYRPDGRIVEVAGFPFEVRKTRAFREMDARLRAGLELARELGASPSAASDPKTVATGALAPGVRVADGDWRASAGARLTLTSRRLRPGRRFDLAEYRLDWSRRRVGLALGHLRPLEDGLASRGFTGRGLVATLARGDPLGLEAGVFLVRSETVTGFEEFLGFDDRDHRVSGGYLRLHPLEDPGALVLGLVVHHGRGPTGGAGAAGGMPGSEGTVVAASASGRLADGLVTWAAEAARSRWDADGPRGLVNSRDDDALRLAVSLAGTVGGPGDGTEDDGEGWDWRLEGIFTHAGPLYTSLLGTTAARGRRGFALGAGLSRGDLAARISWQRTRDVTGGGPALPEHRRDRWHLRLDHGFEEPTLAGLERIGLRATLARTRPVRRLAGIAVTDTFTSGLTLALGGTLAGTAYDLTLEETRSDDRGPADADAVERRLELELERAFLDDRLTLTPRTALGWTREERSGDEAWEQELELGVALRPLWGGRHALELTLYWTRSRDDAGPDETIVRGLEGALTLELIRGRGRDPGLALVLSGAVEEARDDVTGDESDSWRLAATLTASWSPSY